jgi:hypothetical protein
MSARFQSRACPSLAAVVFATAISSAVRARNENPESSMRNFGPHPSSQGSFCSRKPITSRSLPSTSPIPPQQPAHPVSSSSTTRARAPHATMLRKHADIWRLHFIARLLLQKLLSHECRGRAAGGRAAAHSRTCTRWLLVSATTMRPSLSMAMPPKGVSNCPLPEPSLPMVRTWAPSL